MVPKPGFSIAEPNPATKPRIETDLFENNPAKKTMKNDMREKTNILEYIFATNVLEYYTLENCISTNVQIRHNFTFLSELL